jgi:hypothetical protein
MKMQYEEIDEILIPTKRRYAKSNWKAKFDDDVKWTYVTWSNIKFNNSLKREEFE